MPALAFGLKSARPPTKPGQLPTKRKAAFEDDEQDDDGEDNSASAALSKTGSRVKIIPKATKAGDDGERPRKSPKLSGDDGASKYSNLSALRSAKLQDDEASKLDSSVYDYDEVYDTFTAGKNQKSSSQITNPAVPKYMGNLLASAEVRKRDQLRAKEKQLQKEREEEGDEFADKEKFVTGAYKKQQEENRKIEEEERQREEEEEARRRRGAGMTAFHKDMLRKDEERQRAVEEAQRLAQANAGKRDGSVNIDQEKTDSKIAAELNQQGANIVVNDDGEIVDKRQLLSAGLNVAPKKSAADIRQKDSISAKPLQWQRDAKQLNARASQRERQSRMIEKQIEEMEAKQRQAELAEQQEMESRNKSKLTESDKLSAKERYLQRKREREEEAKKRASAA